ncbi:YbaN family protein [Piscinibacter sp. XHJ-5]|uniref:YbaN family protein n=1 Tax=Piscinibacter sp. XHJ-5 TaxID=3037797 RepID=UPI00245330BB|nr:YbaN family protein [Piscinibacter sp. XHJ-5]
MDNHDRSAAWHATAWRVFGAASVAIGIVNAFIPLLPTTVFLLIGVWAWGKGAPEWRARLLAHPRWGEALRLWVNGRQVSRRGKRMATLGIATNWVLSAVFIGPTTAVLAASLGLAALVAWLWWRPEPGSAASSADFLARSVHHD